MLWTLLYHTKSLHHYIQKILSILTYNLKDSKVSSLNVWMLGFSIKAEIFNQASAFVSE